KTKLEGELTNEINAIKSKYVELSEKISTEIDFLEKEIERFCEEHKDAFIKTRSKKLNFGLVAYRISDKVKISCKSATIKSLKALNLDFCLRIKEEIDKDEVKKLDAATLTKIGVKIDKQDKLSIEPDIVEIVAKDN
ncbi:host-nuclease inhibitor Gam family protein, partial [bacterium]|nr:host-nuclease inhibitor Gam family protein [bacterium]